MNKKRYAIVLVLFLLIGLTAFSFANPLSSDEPSDNKKKNQTGGEVELKDSDDQSDTTVTDTDTDVDTNTALYQNVVNNFRTYNVNRNPNTGGTGFTEMIDNSYNLALAAVINAENKLDNDSYNTALDLVNKITTNMDQKDNLLERLEVVKNIIDIKELVSRLEKLTLTASDIDEMNGARDFRKVQEIVEKVDALEDSAVKSELKEKLNVLSGVLDDLTPPTVNIEDGSKYSCKKYVTVNDANKVTMILTDNINNTSINVEMNHEIGEGSYTLTIIDAAFNETTVNFIIDLTAPELVVNGKGALTIEAGIGTYTEEGATVTDNVDETISNLQPAYINYKVNGQPSVLVDSVDTTRPGVYEVIYKYTDQAGNAGIDKWYPGHDFVARFVTVQDTTAPKLVLNGDNIVIVKKNTSYTDLGAIMTDNVDGTITNVQPSAIYYYGLTGVVYEYKLNSPSISTRVSGFYKVVYNYTDNAGNTGVVERWVRVTLI